jgi:methionyl-tRNA formyltransferase
MDSGPVVASRKTRIGLEETTGTLTARLFEMGASLMVEILPRWGQGQIEARPQDVSLATFTTLLSRADAKIDWKLGAKQIGRQVRAYHPWPGTFTHWNMRQLKVIEARVAKTVASHGQSPSIVVLLPNGFPGIVTGNGVLEILRLQLEGRKVVSAREFLQGHPQFVGSSVQG